MFNLQGNSVLHELAWEKANCYHKNILAEKKILQMMKILIEPRCNMYLPVYYYLFTLFSSPWKPLRVPEFPKMVFDLGIASPPILSRCQPLNKPEFFPSSLIP